MTRHLVAAAAALCAALLSACSQTTSGGGPAPLPTTVVLVNLTVKPDIDRALLAKTMPNEIRETVIAALASAEAARRVDQGAQVDRLQAGVERAVRALDIIAAALDDQGQGQHSAAADAAEEVGSRMGEGGL